MDLKKERARYNEKIIVEPIVRRNTQSIYTPIKTTQRFTELSDKELFSLYSKGKFENLTEAQMEELCQETHIRVCKSLNTKPCNVRFDFFTEMGEDYPGKYEPATNEIVINHIYQGFMSDLGQDVGYETLRAVVGLTADQKQASLVSSMMRGDKLNNLEKLVASTKIMNASVTRLEDLQGLKPRRFMMDELLKPENYYSREIANCYIMTQLERGTLPKDFNSSIKNTLIDNFECLDNYNGGGKKSGMIAVIENARFTAMKYEANFDGAISSKVCDTYKSVNESKVLIDMNKLYELQDKHIGGERSM